MILRRIEATNVGPFTGAPVIAGPFGPGMNILSAPNETGKTTLLRATGRALFDRHTCKDAEIRALKPAGTDLAPRVSVEFETGEGRFRAEKTFLQSPSSVLHEHAGGDWKLLAEGDEADIRLTRILQSKHPGRGATNTAHWGLLGYLWMRQGELAEWPAWTGNPAGQLVQSLLVKVEIDPFIEGIRGRMWSVYQENFTTTGQQKVGGTLRETEEALARVEATLVKLSEERQRLTADEDEYARLSEALPLLEAEHVRHCQEANELQEAARRAELTAEEVRRRQYELTTAQDRLRDVQNDRDTYERQARELEEIRRQLVVAENSGVRAGQIATEHQARLAEAERALEAQDARLALLQAAVTRAGKLARQQQSRDDVKRLARTLERSQAQADQIESLVRLRAELPSVAPARLRQLQTLDESIRQRRAQIESLGLTVEITPDAERTVRAGTDGEAIQELPSLRGSETRTLRAVRDLSLDLIGWGTLRIRSGSAETRSLDETVKKDEATLQCALAEFGAASVAAARSFAERAKDLDAQVVAARQALAAMLDRDESPDALRSRHATETRLLQALETELGLAVDAATPTRVELETAEKTANDQHGQGHAARETLVLQSKQAREIARDAAAAREEAAHTVVRLRADADNLERQIAAFRARYADGLQPALDAAMFTYAEAKFTLQKAQEKLPPEAATLGERNRRAAAAAAQVSGELDRKRRARDEIRGRLEWLGSQALYTRETDLLAEQAALTVQAERARARSHAARLVHDLIERRKQAATRTVLAPLQERLGARFAQVSGERARHIFLDESLNIRGLGRKADELVAFDDLSQGAKEQLLLCLRLAVAEELAAVPGGGRQSLILDDVLVNTDAARQGRVLDVLSSAASGGLQILVCTCHPDRYRGVGEVVELRRG